MDCVDKLNKTAILEIVFDKQAIPIVEKKKGPRRRRGPFF
jgi:hypothetical protein